MVADATQWTPQQQDEIQTIAHKTIPGIKTHAVPTDLPGDKVVAYVSARVGEMLSSQ